MRRFARSCLLQLAVWAALGALTHFALGRPVAVSIGASLFALLAILLLDSAVRALRERSMLLDTSPADGRWVAVSGRIQTSSPLRGPLTGEPVAAYDYKIIRSAGTGRAHSIVTWYDGRGLAPTTIVSPAGAVRILTVPSLDELAPADVDRSRAIANAAEHVRTATFEKRDTSQERVAAMAREWDDDDGVFRIDRAAPGAATPDFNEAGFLFEERHLRNGDPVCAFGLYSRERGGIVPDTKWGRKARISRGDAESAERALRTRAIRYVIGAVLLSVPAVWLIVAA